MSEVPLVIVLLITTLVVLKVICGFFVYVLIMSICDLLPRYLRDRLKERAGFHLVLDEIECPNVCFWYLPPPWRTRPIHKVKHAHLHKVAPLIKAKMMESGSLMVQYQPLGDLPNLFRVAISNPILTTRDLEYLMDEIDFLGKEIPVPHDWDD